MKHALPLIILVLTSLAVLLGFIGFLRDDAADFAEHKRMQLIAVSCYEQGVIYGHAQVMIDDYYFFGDVPPVEFINIVSAPRSKDCARPK